MPGILAGLLPSFVAVAEGAIDDIAELPRPEEAAHVARAVASRQAEFFAGRALARRAIMALGGPDDPIPAGDDRVPHWPAGFTGSIAHSKHHVAAAAARTGDAAAIGIDIETWARFRPKLESHILTPGEISTNLSGLDGDERQVAVAIVFSIKEAFYKCQYPVSRARLGFHDAEVRFEAGCFRLTLLATAPPFAVGREFEGRYAVRGDLVGAAMVLLPAAPE